MLVAALPMYDWPELRAETDAEWRTLRERLRTAGIEAPERLARRNADMPPVPGGICGADGRVRAPDPAILPPDGLDLAALWRHPDLLLAQACWGPLEATDLAEFVRVVGQPDYSAYEGGEGPFYSSAILMRRSERPRSVPAPADGAPSLPVDLLRGRRFAFNERHSMSGFLAIERDLEAQGEGIAMFEAIVETGSHRASMRAVAGERADLCAVDCRSWTLAGRLEPAARALAVVGWTGRRKGLPYICSRHLDEGAAAAITAVLS